MSTASQDFFASLERERRWDQRFLRIAREVSLWSKDPSTKVGAVIVDQDRRILATGYNGFPIGVDDSDVRLHDRETKLRYTIHAEMNAILNCSRMGVSTLDTKIYVWGLPTCPDCAKSIVQSGIRRVSYVSPEDRPEWNEAFRVSKLLYDEVGVVCSVFSAVDILQEQA